MTTLAPAPPGTSAERGRARGRSRRPMTLFDEPGGEPTLDELITGVWEGLAAGRAARCPVCAAEMKPVEGAHALPVGGRCARCGSALQ